MDIFWLMKRGIQDSVILNTFNILHKLASCIYTASPAEISAKLMSSNGPRQLLKLDF